MFAGRKINKGELLLSITMFVLSPNVIISELCISTKNTICLWYAWEISVVKTQLKHKQQIFHTGPRSYSTIHYTLFRDNSI